MLSRGSIVFVGMLTSTIALSSCDYSDRHSLCELGVFMSLDGGDSLIRMDSVEDFELYTLKKQGKTYVLYFGNAPETTKFDSKVDIGGVLPISTKQFGKDSGILVDLHRRWPRYLQVVPQQAVSRSEMAAILSTIVLSDTNSCQSDL